MTTQRMTFIGAAAAVVLIGIIFAFSIDRSTEEDIDVVDDPVTTTTATSVEPANPELAPGFGNVSFGTYRLDIFDTPFSFTVETPVWQYDNRVGLLALARPSSDGPGDLDVEFMQLTRLWDPTQPDTPLRNQGDAWPAGDFAGWLDNLPDWVVVSSRQDTTVGGRPAIAVDLEIGDVECVEQDPYCIGFGIAGGHLRGLLGGGGASRAWVIDVGEGSTLAVVAGALTEEDRAWFASVDELVASISFEE